MQKLIELILREPILAFIVLGAVFQVLGQIFNRGKASARQRRAPSPTTMQRPPVVRRAPTAEEVAAEMRRILGMDQPASSPPPKPAPVRREVIEKPPEPLRTQTLGSFKVHVDPHVGEAVGQRIAPLSGGVGARQLGTLGGRVSGGARRRRRGSRLVDLSDLSRAIVLREILDKPVGLRDLQ